MLIEAFELDCNILISIEILTVGIIKLRDIQFQDITLEKSDQVSFYKIDSFKSNQLTYMLNKQYYTLVIYISFYCHYFCYTMSSI